VVIGAISRTSNECWHKVFIDSFTRQLEKHFMTSNSRLQHLAMINDNFKGKRSEQCGEIAIHFHHFHRPSEHSSSEQQSTANFKLQQHCLVRVTENCCKLFFFWFNSRVTQLVILFSPQFVNKIISYCAARELNLHTNCMIWKNDNFSRCTHSEHRIL
jgi:hypothetical protein